MSNGGNSGGGSKIPPQMWFYIIGIPLILGGGYFGIMRPILKKFGVIKSLEDKELKKINEDVERQPFWKPSWYQANGGDTLTSAEARHFAKELAEAMHGKGTWWDVGWGTDENKIASVFRKLNSKGNISKVAEEYSNMYSKDLLTSLNRELNEEEFGNFVSQPISQYGGKI